MGNPTLKRKAFPILTLAILAIGPLALDAAQNDKGEIVVTPPSIPAAKRFEPLEVVFEVRPPAGVKGPFEATLILTSFGGKPRTYAARTTDGKTFRATAIPSQPEDSIRLRVTLIDDTSELVFESPDRMIMVGGKSVKLSDVRRMEFRDDPRVVTDSGEVHRGSIMGLDALPAELSGKSLELEPLKAQRMLVNRIDNPAPIVAYRIVAKRKEQVVAETSGRIQFKPDFLTSNPPPTPFPARTLAFAAPVLYDTLGAADIITAGDLDGDRHIDLVVGGGPTLGVLYGRGDGQFERYDLLLAWRAKVANRLLVDLNGDRLPEVIFFDTAGHMVTLENRGRRRFDEPKLQKVGNANRVIAADFNRDGRLDLAVTTRDRRTEGAQARVYLNHPAGLLVEEPKMTVEGYSDGIAAADVNRDGILDLAIGASHPGGLGVFYGSPQGGFVPGPRYKYGEGYTHGVTLEDLNGDGSPELISADYWGGKLLLMKNRGDGSFLEPVPYEASPYPLQIHAFDLDGDGKKDLAVPGARKGIGVFRNRGDGTFDPAITFSTGGDNGRSCVVADFNRDGKLDLAVAHERDDATVGVLLNTGGK